MFGRLFSGLTVFVASFLLGWICTPVLLIIGFALVSSLTDIPDSYTPFILIGFGIVSLISPLFYARIIWKRRRVDGSKIVAKAKVRSKKPKSEPRSTAQAKPQPAPPTSSGKSNKPKTLARLTWHGSGELIQIGRYRIANPLTYCSDGKPEEDEPSCIDLRAAVGTPKKEKPGALGYWPSYSGLTKNQKADYLEWMLSGRGEAPDIGYAFIFFYGLERRCLIDDADHQAAITEMCRLLQKNRSSKSFNGYLSRFLAYLTADLGMKNVDENGFRYIFDESVDLRYDECLDTGLAWFYENNKPLPPAWAERVAARDPRSPRSVVPDRVPEEYGRLFEQRYAQAFDRGMLLKTSARHRGIAYVPASAALRGIPIPPIEIPHVAALSSQFTPLIEIRNQCIDELKKLSRLTLKGDEVTTREAYDALPDDLKQEQEHPDAPRWNAVLNADPTEEGRAITPIFALAEIHGIEKRDRLTKKQGESLCVTADQIGLGIEPDTRLTGSTYKWDEPVALFRRANGMDDADQEKYAGASLVLELGFAVAAADGEVERGEVDQITRFLEGAFNVGPDLARRLLALKALFMKHPPALTRLASRLKKIDDEEQRKKVGEFALSIAASDGIITKEEIKLIQRLYKALDIPAEKLDELISRKHPDVAPPVEVKKGKKRKKKGETLLPPREEDESPELTLDPDRIREIMIQTREVATILGKAMGEITDESEPTIEKEDRSETAARTEIVDARTEIGDTKTEINNAKTDAGVAQTEINDTRTDAGDTQPGINDAKTDTSDARTEPAQTLDPDNPDNPPVPPDIAPHILEGLDPRYHAVLGQLLTEPSWERDRFEEVVRGHTLMPSSTIAILNDWAEERLGDFLIEDDETLTINRSLIEESE